MTNEKLILERIELFVKVYSEYEVHLNPIPSRLFYKLLYGINCNQHAILFTIQCLKVTSFCSEESSSTNDEIYVNNLIKLFNSESYQKKIHTKSSDEEIIRQIFESLLFFQSYEFKLNFELGDYKGLYETYRTLTLRSNQRWKNAFEQDCARRYMRQFGLKQIPPTCFITKVFTKGDVIRLHFDYSTDEYKKLYHKSNPMILVSFSYYFPEHIQKFRTR